MSEFRRRKNETTKGEKVSSFVKTQDLKTLDGNWSCCGLAVVIPVVTLMWYSNNQKN